MSYFVLDAEPVLEAEVSDISAVGMFFRRASKRTATAPFIFGPAARSR